jgi:hypothetical protein
MRAGEVRAALLLGDLDAGVQPPPPANRLPLKLTRLPGPMSENSASATGGRVDHETDPPPKDPIYVMNQLGHTDPAFTMRVYAHMMSRTPQEREKLKALVEGPNLTFSDPATPDTP